MKRRRFTRLHTIPEARRNSISFFPDQHDWLLERSQALELPLSEILRRIVEHARLTGMHKLEVAPRN